MLSPIHAKLAYWGAGFVAFGVLISVSVPSLFHILAIIPAVVVNLYYFKKKSLNLPKSAYVLIALIVWGYIVNFINFDQLNDPIRSFGKVKYWIFAVLSIGLFRYAFENYIDNFKVKRILNIFWFSIIASACYGFYKDYPNRISGFTGIMRYGYGMSFILTIMLGVTLHYSKLKKFINARMFLSAFVIGLFGFLATKTRGAFLGGVVALPFVFYLYNKRIGKFVGAITAVLVSVIVIISVNGGNSSFRILEKVGVSSNLKRLSQYEAALNSIKNNPIVGLGVNNFSSKCLNIKEKFEIHWPKYCAKYPVLNCYYKAEDHPRYCGHSHNIVLEHAANLGVLGAFLLVLWGACWLYEMIYLKTTFSMILIPFIINLFVAGQFENIFDANNSFLIFFLYPLSFIKGFGSKA